MRENDTVPVNILVRRSHLERMKVKPTGLSIYEHEYACRNTQNREETLSTTRVIKGVRVISYARRVGCFYIFLKMCQVY